MPHALTHTLLHSDVGVGRWTLDPERTTVRIRHKTFWGLATVKGVFTDVTGDGEVGVDHTVTGRITVGASSVDTKNAKRDGHLRGSTFFDVDTHPHFVISVHSVAEEGDRLQLEGELTIKDVRQPLTLFAEVRDLDLETLAVHITGAVDRHRFGVSHNQLGMIPAVTSLDIDAVFVRQSV